MFGCIPESQRGLFSDPEPPDVFRAAMKLLHEDVTREFAVTIKGGSL